MPRVQQSGVLLPTHLLLSLRFRVWLFTRGVGPLVKDLSAVLGPALAEVARKHPPLLEQVLAFIVKNGRALEQRWLVEAGKNLFAELCLVQRVHPGSDPAYRADGQVLFDQPQLFGGLLALHERLGRGVFVLHDHRRQGPRLDIQLEPLVRDPYLDQLVLRFASFNSFPVPLPPFALVFEHSRWLELPAAEQAFAADGEPESAIWLHFVEGTA